MDYEEYEKLKAQIAKTIDRFELTEDGILTLIPGSKKSFKLVQKYQSLIFEIAKTTREQVAQEIEAHSKFWLDQADLHIGNRMHGEGLLEAAAIARGNK